jgi:hypothetical protein
MKFFYGFIVFIFLTIQFAIGQAVWHQYQGPCGGNVTALTSIGDTLYCGGYLRYVYRSIDFGHTWQTIKRNDGNVYTMCSYNSKLFIGGNNTVDVSENNGIDWIRTSNDLYVHKFQLFEDKLFACTSTGVFQFDSETNTWIDKSNGIFPDIDGNLDIRDITSVGEKLFCSSRENFFYTSSNKGETWIKQSSILEDSTLLIDDIITFNDTLFVMTNYKVYFSADTGKNWTSIYFPYYWCGGFLWIANYKNQLFFATYMGLLKFEPKDLTFSTYNYDIYDNIIVKDSIFFASNRFGLYRLNTENDSFVFSNKGIHSSCVRDMALFNQSLYCALDDGLYYTCDNGENWTIVPETKWSICTSINKLDTMLFVGTGYGIIATSEHASGWSNLNDGLSYGVVRDIEVIDSTLFIAKQEGIFKSVDHGQHWEQINNFDLTDNGINQIASGNNMILVATCKGLYKISPDRTSIDLIGFDNDYVRSVNIIDKNIYVALLGGPVYKSMDTCKTWAICLSSDIFHIYKRGDDNLYALGVGTIYYSPDAGNTWESFSETGLPDLSIQSMLQGDSCMYVGTFGESVYKRAYLKFADCISNKYEIDDAIISNVSDSTTINSLSLNLQVSHGAYIELDSPDLKSARVIKNTLIQSGQNYLKSGDKINVVAEDEITKKTYIIAIATGIKSNPIQQVFIYPNPAFDKLTISNISLTNSRILIYDIRGIKVIDKPVVEGEIDISTLAKGVYIVKLVNSDIVIENKLLKE